MSTGISFGAFCELVEARPEDIPAMFKLWLVLDAKHPEGVKKLVEKKCIPDPKGELEFTAEGKLLK